jgi:small subunit ribosomal protein S19
MRRISLWGVTGKIVGNRGPKVGCGRWTLVAVFSYNQRFPTGVVSMSRSRKKGPYVDERLLTKVERNQRTNNREPIKTWSRDCTIVPDFIGVTFLIHNGRQFTKLYVTEDMVDHKLGEFAPTRTFRSHSGGKGKK